MWEDKQECESNCQCSGLITENFKINSGNNATKRKQETSASTNFQLKMNPHTLDFTSPTLSPKATPSKRRVLGELNFNTSIDRHKSPESPFKSPLNLKPLNLNPSPLSITSPLMNSPIISHSPLTTRLKKTSKISKVFEERTRFKLENKENFSNFEMNFKEDSYKESFVDLEETARDFSFGERFSAGREQKNWSSVKLDFTDAIPSKPFEDLVPGQTQDLEELETLQDLETEFESSFEQCTKYEIISTDSPNVISMGRSTSRKICSRNFEFGSSLTDSEPSTSFNRPATRMLNFDNEDFEFTSPAIKKAVSVKKSLQFTETETKLPLRHERSDSSIGSMSSSPGKLSRTNSSPGKLSRILTSESTASIESGFISELDDHFEESNSPKITNFSDLLSGPIKDNILTDKNFMKRPSLVRSLSFHPESKIQSPSEEKRKREEYEERSNKRRKSNVDSPIERVARPVLQRAFSENNASIKSALARSSTNADLIGDYSCGYTLPLMSGEHEDLKSISCDTLAALLTGQYRDTVPDFQVVDCRYPYEFEGGHIASAVNLYTTELVQELVTRPPHKKLLVFHCEFSIERGPKLSRALRSFDRVHHRSTYPALAYPEMYLLHGGYRAFHAAHPSLCSPAGYTRMLDPQHKHLLRRHRSLQGRNRLLM